MILQARGGSQQTRDGIVFFGKNSATALAVSGPGGIGTTPKVAPLGTFFATIRRIARRGVETTKRHKGEVSGLESQLQLFAMPIPESLPGHQALHDRVVAALDVCQESQPVDFNESASWPQLEIGIIKNAMAMANLRDGGVTIVGASERDGQWQLTGITNEHLATYDLDTIIGRVHRFASPHVDLEVVTVRYANGNRFLAIHAREFERQPVICARNGPDGSGLIAGAVYVRPPGVPQSTRVMEAEQMRDLIELAAEKVARRILRQGLRAGLQPPGHVNNEFDEEIGDL